MTIQKLLVCALLLLTAVGSVLAQATLDIGYFPPPEYPNNFALGTPCTGPRAAFGDTVAIALFWDRNLNGPSADDVQPPAGPSGSGQDTVNQNLWYFNGEAAGLGAGYFGFDPSLTLYGLRPDSSYVYYLRISRLSPAQCWTTDTFRVIEGFNTLYLDSAQWHCVNQVCQISGNPPEAPTNVHASDDLYCLGVQVAWAPLQSTQSAFNVYQDDGTEAVATAGAQDTSVNFPVYTDVQHTYTVKAVNVAGESPASNSDNGSTFLVRFAANTNITGPDHANQAMTVHFRVPPESQEPCPYGTELYLLRRVTADAPLERFMLLASDSLNDSLSFVFPNNTNVNYCRLLLVDSSFSSFAAVVFTDTANGVFHLGHPLAADPGTDLLPDHFELAQNFPNPFNPSTEIQFSVPMQSEIRIQVYNIMGQLVKTLAQGSFAVGVHRMVWDGKSDNGLDVSAGIYIYRMEGPSFVSTKKMLLLK